jgi:alkylation response protein AidB-like acyl-CoA dehydrogenase
MDLTLSEKHQALADEVAQFVARQGTRAPKPHAGYQPPDERMLDWQALLVEHGYSARTVPREYGGFGAAPDVLEGAIIAEGFARAGVWQGFMNQGVRMVAPTLLEVGTEAQKRDYVRPTILGRMLWCQGYSEPGAGSDLASVQTRAVRDGDDYVINGQKIWTSFAHYAHMIYVLCRTEPDRPKHAGLSYLVLSMKTPGIEVRPLPNMTGRREFNEVFFTDVRVPAGQMVMGPGDGWKVAQVNLKHERLKLGDPDKIAQRLHRLVTLMRAPQADGRVAMQRARAAQPAAAAAGRGRGAARAPPAPADRAGAGHRLGRQAPDRQARRHRPAVAPVGAGARRLRRDRAALRAACRCERRRRGHGLELRPHVRPRHADRRRHLAHPEEHHRRARPRAAARSRAPHRAQPASTGSRRRASNSALTRRSGSSMPRCAPSSAAPFRWTACARPRPVRLRHRAVARAAGAGRAGALRVPEAHGGLGLGLLDAVGGGRSAGPVAACRRRSPASR